MRRTTAWGWMLVCLGFCLLCLNVLVQDGKTDLWPWALEPMAQHKMLTNVLITGVVLRLVMLGKQMGC
jgi:hypothetical protein